MSLETSVVPSSPYRPEYSLGSDIVVCALLDVPRAISVAACTLFTRASLQPTWPRSTSIQFGPPDAAPRRSNHRQPRGQATVSGPSQIIPRPTGRHAAGARARAPARG
ncbi:hypothetical protein NDU88_007060 [Pleurodeles waltl]|uniref:Uncharacterized protein n=1 Tax=Pleurodeles waltl TaxID=8319 RepID=A0AAV7TZK7_PLEWA|nr:hypothetical protein NDU88_007060 [Pleurodeles waltl]